MIARQIAPGIHQISLGLVNTFLVDSGELTLIDTGVEGSDRKILRALEELGKSAFDLRHILITHLHSDHTGGLAALKKASGATTYMHALDVADYQQGITMRQIQRSRGLMSGLMAGMFAREQNQRVDPAPIDQTLEDGQVLDFAGGLRVIHAPGHTRGHVAFLAPVGGGVLILGDACNHLGRLGLSPIYEDRSTAQQTLKMLLGFDYEIVCFAHGGPITAGGKRQMETKFTL